VAGAAPIYSACQNFLLIVGFLEPVSQGKNLLAFPINWDEETWFLASCKPAALTGQIAAAPEIKAALERRIGPKIHKTTVYSRLKRQGWRKVLPLPFPVDADKEEQEA
jgi:hypothetical protein